MARSLKTTAYPPTLQTALERAVDLGEFVIPTAHPAALRLQFYGYCAALRREGRPEYPDLISLHIQESPSALIIRLKDTAPIFQDIANALGVPPLPVIGDNLPTEAGKSEDIDAAFNRIFGV